MKSQKHLKKRGTRRLIGKIASHVSKEKLEKEIIPNRGVYFHQRYHTLALFWSKSMTLLSGAIWDLTWQHMQGKCASQYSSLPKAPYKLSRSRIIKREGKIALVRNHLQMWVTWTNHSRNKSYLYDYKIIQKPKFLGRERVRRFKSKLFHFSITQDILVDTWKFIGSGEAWNNLYADFQIKEMNPFSP